MHYIFSFKKSQNHNLSKKKKSIKESYKHHHLLHKVKVVKWDRAIFLKKNKMSHSSSSKIHLCLFRGSIKPIRCSPYPFKTECRDPWPCAPRMHAGWWLPEPGPFLLVSFLSTPLWPFSLYGQSSTLVSIHNNNGQ